MTTTLSPTIDLKSTDEPVKADGWLNLEFLRDGRSILGQVAHPSEEAAQRFTDAFHGRCAELDRASLHGGIIITAGDGGFLYRWSDYSHTIQIPWRKP